MILRTETLLDEITGAPISGAKIYVYDINGDPAVLTSDGTTPLTQPVTTDTFGTYNYYAATGYYTEDIFLGARRIWKQASIAIGTPGADLTLRSDLTTWGLLTVTPQQFGAVGGGIIDDSAAFVAAIAYLKTLGVNRDTYYQGSPRLFVPAGTYNMGTTTLDITHTLIIEGESSINGYGSLLKWSGDATGIRIQAYNTSGASGTVTPGFNGGNYTIIRNLGLGGPYYNSNNFTGKTESENHGIHARSNYIIEDCDIDGFAGDGVYAETSSGGGGALEGNSNCSFINRLKVTNVRNGLFVDGADSNAGTFIGIVGTYCRRWTVWDSSFLGNTHIGHHSSGAGLIRGVAPSISGIGGNRFAVVSGQETGASTNPPKNSTVTITIASPGVVSWTAHGLPAGTAVAFSTTGALPTGFVAATTYYVVNPTTDAFQLAATSGGSSINTSGSQSGTHTASAGLDNTWWLYLGPGAIDSTLNIAIWTNGTTYRAGGSYHTDNLNGYSTLVGLYEEGGQAPAQISLPTAIVGGLWGTRNPVTTGNWFGGSRCNINWLKLVPQNDPGVFEDGGLWCPGSGAVIKAHLSGSSVDLINQGYTSPNFVTSITVNGTKVVGTRDTGWTADTGTARKAANATYAAGTTLTYSAGYVQAEQTAMATRMAAVEAALQNLSQTQKAIKDAQIAAGSIGT